MDNTINVNDIEIQECRAQVACMLNELWHSRLPLIHWSNVVRNTHYVCFVFKYKEAIIGVGIWSSPVAQNRMKDGKRILELRRLALSNVCPKNTASKVISVMIDKIKEKFPEIIKLVSYQDTEVHLGTIYKASNWVKGGEVDFIDWSSEKRKRNKIQSDASKIRWEYHLDK
jgi:hypothetical protein